MTVSIEAAPAVVDRPPRGRAVAIRLAIGLSVGVVLFLVFVQLINFHEVAERLEHLNFAYALLCGAAFLAAYAVRALRWRLFLAPDRIRAGHIIGIYYVATFLNWALPVQGGEVAKSVILRRSDGIAVNRSLATIAMDKTMDLLPAIALLLLVPFATLRLSGALWAVLGFSIVVLACIVTILAFAMARPDRTKAIASGALRRVLPNRLAARAEPFIEGFLDTLLALLHKPRMLGIATAYTAVAVSLDALFCFFAFHAVGVSVGWTVVLFGYTFYNLAYILPTPPAHIGGNELMGLLVFSGLFHVDRESVGAMFLFSHPWTGFLMTGTALISLRAIGLSLRSTLRLQSGADSAEEEQ
jgi:uncharacterized protein (TIRG00374 family)